MTERAWYLGCTREDVGPAAVLVGDRARAHLAAELLDDARVVNESRGLTTVTGTWKGQTLTVSAFGMGAPIAAVVMHELSLVGVRAFLRLGTALTFGATRLGDLVLSEGAYRGESTSSTYLPLAYPAVPDFGLNRVLHEILCAQGRPHRSGLYASFDGFYTEMFDAHSKRLEESSPVEKLAEFGVVALDMETSAVLVAARRLGVSAASLCLATVEHETHSIMGDDERADAERELLAVGFDGLVRHLSLDLAHQ